MLLERWDESSFNQLFDLEKQIEKERIFLQRKYDLKGKLPENGWGRRGVVVAANEANGYYDYQFLLMQAEQRLDQIKAQIKGIYALLEWGE